MPSKPFWQSKTLWANVLAIAVYVGKAYFGISELPDVDPMVIVAINLVLRLLTRTSVSFS